MTLSSSLRLEKITPENVTAACRLKVRPEQENVVAPVAWSLAEAYANLETAWPRLIFDGDELVGFVMGGFDPDGPVDAFRCGIWRLNIATGLRTVRRGVGARRGTPPWPVSSDGVVGCRRERA